MTEKGPLQKNNIMVTYYVQSYYYYVSLRSILIKAGMPIINRRIYIILMS